MTKTEKATQWMERIANDNSYGYLYGGWGPKDYDCGHAIITAWEVAGVPLKSRGATYTGNIYQVARACGFSDVTSVVNRSTGAGMHRGDILLNTADHAAMFVGDGKLVHARSSEGNSISGDQSGNEIRIQSYFNYPWDRVLRYPEVQEDPSTEETDSIENPTNHIDVPRAIVEVHFGDKTKHAKAVQCMLNGQYDREDILDEDGEIGVKSYTEIVRFQRRRGLESDGIVGPLTWAELQKV